MKIVIEMEGKRLDFDRSELIRFGNRKAVLSPNAAAALFKALPDGYGNVSFTILVDGRRLEGCHVRRGIEWGKEWEVDYLREVST
ncbi:MAG TPA: hypothetical protein VE093_05565 [Polyangiaceae bacterium]|jgi:hypothetical protein|nr:hypothetical protein [Polyangiaceae bacterium]